MEQNALFRKRYGSFRRFFAMLGKARLPYLWIVGYLAVSALIANVSVSTTEYSAALFAGQVGLFAVVLPYLFFTLLSLVIGSISSLTSNLCLARIDRNLRRMVWKKVVHLPLQFYEANNPKELLSRITTDVTSISTLIMQVLLPVFTTAYSSLLMLGRVSSYDQRLMWALVIVLPVNILISFVLGRMRFGVADLINRRNAQLTAAIAERANNMLLIKSMGTEEKEAVAGEARMKASYQAEVTDLWVRGLALPINAIASALQSVAIILAGRAFYSTGALDLTQWIAYYGFAIQLTNILSNYCNSWSNFKGAQGSVDRVSQIMDEQEEPLDKGRDAGALAGNISLRDVCFSYGDTALFTGLDAEIPAGKITAIVGPSGSGKTTLLNLIDRLYPLAKGTIAVDGRDIAGISLHSFRQAVGLCDAGERDVFRHHPAKPAVWFGPHAGRPGTGSGLRGRGHSGFCAGAAGRLRHAGRGSRGQPVWRAAAALLGSAGTFAEVRHPAAGRGDRRHGHSRQGLCLEEHPHPDGRQDGGVCGPRRPDAAKRRLDPGAGTRDGHRGGQSPDGFAAKRVLP